MAQVLAVAGQVIKSADINANFAEKQDRTYSTTATAAGNTILTVASNFRQMFTGATTQTVTLPVASTMVALGRGFFIANDSTGALTINSSGGNLIKTLPAGGRLFVTVILLSGITAASWSADYVMGVSTSDFLSNKTLSYPIVFDAFSMVDQGADPAAPAAGYKNYYAKAGGIYYRISAGTVYQMSNLEETQTFTGAKTFQNASFTTNALNLTVGQIAFPASQNPSAGANTLDDYEEANFTPIIRGNGTAGTGTYTTQIGRVTRVGRVNFFTAYVAWTNLTGGTGTMQIGGLPFAAENTTSLFHSVSLYNNGVLMPASSQLQALISPNTTVIDISSFLLSTGAVTGLAIDTAGAFVATGFYIS